MNTEKIVKRFFNRLTKDTANIVRQYPDGEGEYYQLCVCLVFEPDSENRLLQDIIWSDDTDEDFFDYICKSAGFGYANKHAIKSIDIRMDQT